MLRIEGLTKTFLPGTPNEHKALQGIDLHLQRGDFYTVIGTNGSGKSTLFNAVAGNFWVDTGHILLDGQNITYLKEHRRARIIGRMFQDPMKGTAPDMTIEENLSLAYSRRRRSPLSPAIRRLDSEFFRETLSRLEMGLEDRMKTKMGLLSGGQRQAVTLLMSTLTTPKLLLLDEHTAALDPMSAEKVLTLTKEIIAKNNITTLMITHNITSALELGTHTIMMDRGKIVLTLAGQERKDLTVAQLLELYREKSSRQLDNDRMLLE